MPANHPIACKLQVATLLCPATIAFISTRPAFSQQSLSFRSLFKGMISSNTLFSFHLKEFQRRTRKLQPSKIYRYLCNAARLSCCNYNTFLYCSV